MKKETHKEKKTENKKEIRKGVKKTNKYELITILLPAYNEEKNIERFEKELIKELDQLKKKYEVIVVDDGSSDKTLEKLLGLKKKYPQVKIISYKKNGGMGKAIRRGIKLASGDILIMLDSDLTFHPREISKLLDCYEKRNVDCVVGSYIGGTGDVNFFRLFLSKSVNQIYSIILGSKITCISPIFKLYKTEQLKKLKLTSKGFTINAEIVVKLMRQKKKFAEVPVTLTKRIYGESKINITQAIRNHLAFMPKAIKWRRFS